MCIAENLDCVSSIKIDNFDCLQQCSGILVPSYDEEDIEEGIKNEMVKLVKYLIRKDDWWLYHDMQVEFKGLLNSKYEVEDKINKLTSDYWNYKTSFDFPSQYKGSCLCLNKIISQKHSFRI